MEVCIDKSGHLFDRLLAKTPSSIHPKHHKDNNYFFWPDLVKFHYAKACVSWMSENIDFVPKSMNPPNLPQACPFENCWGGLVQKV